MTAWFDRWLIVGSNGTGLQGMHDRLDAIGGSLKVTSAVGAGTTVTGVVPIRRADGGQSVAASQADSSRSGPNDDLGM